MRGRIPRSAPRDQTICRNFWVRRGPEHVGSWCYMRAAAGWREAGGSFCPVPVRVIAAKALLCKLSTQHLLTFCRTDDNDPLLKHVLCRARTRNGLTWTFMAYLLPSMQRVFAVIKMKNEIHWNDMQFVFFTWKCISLFSLRGFMIPLVKTRLAKSDIGVASTENNLQTLGK